MYRAHSTSVRGGEREDRTRRWPVVPPAATLVVCSAARCISLAWVRAPQHEQRLRMELGDWLASFAAAEPGFLAAAYIHIHMHIHIHIHIPRTKQYTHRTCTIVHM